jgi:hypothetical protein
MTIQSGSSASRLSFHTGRDAAAPWPSLQHSRHVQAYSVLCGVLCVVCMQLYAGSERRACSSQR